MRSISLVGVAALVAGLLNGAAWATDLGAAKLGQKIADVTLADRAGKKVALYDLQGKKAIVVVFLSFECPISTSYSPLLADLAKRYAEQGATFVGVCASDGETAESVSKQGAEFKLGFPVLYDSQGAAVAAFKAEKTPEVFVLDHNAVLRYRGRIDDGYAARLKKNMQIKSHDLEKALDEVVNGKPVSQPITEVIGCPIGVERKIQRDGAVTYYRDVAPILQSRCQECHRPGQVGPFALMTFKQAVNWADDVKDYTQSHQMPPWKITTGIGFRHDRRMTDKEIATLAAWVDGGTPEGNPADAPPPRKFVDGWRLGTPDLILTTNEDFVVGPGGRDEFRCFVLPTDLPEDKFVVAYEVKPSNPRVVHHTLNFIDTDGEGRELERAAQSREKRSKKPTDYDRGPGYSSSMGVGFAPRGGLGGWAPGQVPQLMPEGYGFKLPKKADVVVQVHYHRNGRVERDRLKIGFYFAKKSEGMKAYKTGMIAGRFFAIPRDEANFKVTGSTSVKYDCVLHSIMPHMHLLGRQIKVTLKSPGEKKQTLLEIGSWDYNWQETYFLKEPMKLKVGTVLSVEAVYDNSAANPNTPNSPPRLVTLGEQTTNEMCFVFLGATTDGPGRSPFAGPFGGRRRERESTHPPEKRPETKKPPATNSEPVTKN
jgi:peroxiredoxin